MLNRHLLPLLFSFFCAVIFVPIVIAIARRTGAVAHGDARRRIQNPVPLLGGVAVYLSVLANVFLFHLPVGFALIDSALPLLVVGILDDYKELSARPKVIVQLLAATVWVLTRAPGDLALEQIGLLHGAAVFGSIFWIVGVTNAMNLVDGMDGVAASLAIIAATALSFFAGSSDLSVVMGIVSGAAIGFLFYNMPPARVYLGDSGSTLLGFMLAASCSVLQLPKNGVVGIFIPMLLLAYPQADTVIAIARRIINKKPIFSGDHSHLHHKLQKIGFSVPVALGIISLVGAYSALGAYSMWFLDSSSAFLSLMLTVLGLVGLVAVVFQWDRVLGKKVAEHAHGIVGKFLASQNVRATVNRKYAGILLDLSHCYEEFQHFTPDQVEAFAKDFALLLKKFFPSELLRAGERNSIIVYYAEPVNPADSLLGELRSELRNLFREYNALDSEDETLETMVLRLSESRIVEDIDVPGLKRVA